MALLAIAKIRILFNLKPMTFGYFGRGKKGNKYESHPRDTNCDPTRQSYANENFCFIFRIASMDGQTTKKIDWTYAAADGVSKNAALAVSHFQLNIIFKHTKINTPWNVIQLYAIQHQNES